MTKRPERVATPKRDQFTTVQLKPRSQENGQPPNGPDVIGQDAGGRVIVAEIKMRPSDGKREFYYYAGSTPHLEAGTLYQFRWSARALVAMVRDEYKRKPPRSAEFLLLLVPKEDRRTILGDLEEEYQTIVLPRHGAIKAQRWYWGQVLACVLPYVWRLARRVGSAVLGAIALHRLMR